MKNLGKVILVLILLEVALTGFLAYQDLVKGMTGFCVVGNEVGCDGVQNSVYGKLFGVKLSFFGFFSFLVLLAVFAYENKKKSNLFFVLTLVGALFAFYFIYLQIFVLRQICSSCVVVDGTAILIFILTFVYRKHRWSIG